MIKKLMGKRPSSAFRLCVIGNSHVSALKLAWNKLGAEYPDIEITFFASPGKSVRRVKAVGTRIVPTSKETRNSFGLTSGGQNTINIKRYDAFLCYGTLPWRPIVATPYSRAFSFEAVKGVIQRSMLSRHLNMLHGRTQKAVFASAAPLPSPLYRESGELLLPADEFRETIHEYISVEYGAKLIWQPEETVVEGGFASQERFSTGSQQLGKAGSQNKAHSERDIVHMNQAYGELWLKAFLPRLKGL